MIIKYNNDHNPKVSIITLNRLIIDLIWGKIIFELLGLLILY